jgi:nucleotide-binding universal stress UspA family protein
MRWAIDRARDLETALVAVYVIESPPFLLIGYKAPVAGLDGDWREGLKNKFEGEWLRELKESGIPYRALMGERDAMIVLGRRGLGRVPGAARGSVSE